MWGKGEAEKCSPADPAENQRLALCSLVLLFLVTPGCDTVTPKELLWRGGLSCLVWKVERGILWDTGGAGTHTYSHHLHSGLISGRQLPSPNGRAAILFPCSDDHYSGCIRYQKCRFPSLQVLLSQGMPRCVPASSQAQK